MPCTPSLYSNALTLAVPISAPGATPKLSPSLTEVPAVSLRDTVATVLAANEPTT